MRHILILLACLLLPVSAAAQETPQIVTVLVGIDGFRPDYLDRNMTPRLSALAAEGASGAMRPSFPTKTFPNHYAIVTGKVPDRNGIVGNSMIDPRRPGQIFSLGNARQALDPFWWDEAEPVWVTAERAGIRTATMFWPGSEVPYEGLRPSDWMRFDQNVTNVQRVNTLIDWLRRPASLRPAFATIYFDTVDTQGHRFGPDSAEANAAIAEVDARVGDLVDGAKALGIAVNWVIVADHGMRQVDETRVIQLDTLIDRASYIAVETGPYAAIEPVTGTDDRVANALLVPHEHMTCTRKEGLPARLNYGSNPRVAAIICIAENGWTILSGEPNYPVSGGAHGYDNADPEMLALFIAHGPAFAEEQRMQVFDNVAVAALLRAAIGLPQDPYADGKLEDLADALRR
ncbi:nucleotide pyrophosphatase/phosphodiesterase family protein [Porphyrobacter sp. AAP60]|uniref:nucleotide pyrophosphatase/phosphodiesterase family protein n=1 Tax=Porphyrobacter sp. AAP60 TaxID=1523423 RepID=UPI0006B9301D|nr:nucleotide pyrophosphatase/phosphodiesterase family protein [Porphyrobacter sp. AAP60]KPF65142.1 phosphodiesterase [Porphyrobacter sp. AAP60]